MRAAHYRGDELQERSERAGDGSGALSEPEVHVEGRSEGGAVLTKTIKLGEFDAEVVEERPGVKTLHIKGGPKHATCDTDFPWIHYHYMTDDLESEETGWFETELCCHGCATGLMVKIPWPPVEDVGAPVRDSFKDQHRHCDRKAQSLNDPLGMFELMGGFREAIKRLCPVERKLVLSMTFPRPKTPKE